MTDAPVLAVRDLRVAFASRGRGEVQALGGVSLDIHAGEFVAIVGPSGCGKSTLLRALGGLLPRAARVEGTVHVERVPDGSRSTAWMPQRDSLLPWRRALGNALVGAEVVGADRAQARERALALLDEFGIGDHAHSWPHELSGGMRQRLALARTCMADRPSLLLDEPFGALDPVTRRRMNQWLADVDLLDRAPQGSGRGAVVLVTHDVDEALALATRVVVMSPRPGLVVLDRPAAGLTRADLLACLDGTAA